MDEEQVEAGAPHLGWALAGLSAGAGVIHFAMVPVHSGSGWEDTLGFALAGWFQLLTAALVLMDRGSKRLYQAIMVANLAFVGAWLWSRTAGLPWGPTPGVAEPVAAIDLVAVGMEVGVVLLALRLALAPGQRTTGRLAPALVAVGALGLATVVVTSPDAANHSHANVPTGLDALRADVEAKRCDRDLNIPAYWKEASYLGVDTDWGGSPPTVAGSVTSPDGHNHGATVASGAATTTTDPDPYQGRGSPGLDDMVSATSLAATSEIEAANLINALSSGSDRDYRAWLWWLRSSGALNHSHPVTSATSTAEDGSGHGGHVGPQPWVAVTSKAQCDRLLREVALARATALKYPTVADAEKAGYHLVTGYLPGIAAHYIKGSLIDGRFEIDKPEMILYDGVKPTSHVVGLSYYLWHPGDNKPTQGFTGDNDHGHRHIGLCSSPDGVIIGDSTTSEADCAARGGTKDDGSKGWMSHAWVVPGCESPWGIFSAANPLLDGELMAHSGKDGGHCAGAGQRDRYQMDDVAPADDGESAAPAKGVAGN
ncbi:MAG: hypothetical protein U0P45_04750 [Acidimicrobiales bacterium]